MEVTLLGYQLIDFVNKDGSAVKGCKFYFCFDSEKRNYFGMEVASYFADFIHDRILYDMVQHCEIGKKYLLELIPSFSGKTKINSINPVK